MYSLPLRNLYTAREDDAFISSFSPLTYFIVGLLQQFFLPTDSWLTYWKISLDHTILLKNFKD